VTASTSTRESIAAGMSQAPLPGVWRVGLSRGQVELKAFFRERQSVVFIFAMPAVMLVLLGAISGIPRPARQPLRSASPRPAAATQSSTTPGVSRIIEQSAERAGIIDQLEATRAELAAAQHEAGRLAERQRLAADIHDTLAQGFTSVLMLIQAAQADLDGSHPRAGRHLDLAARAARENLAEARALVAGLPPAQLDGGTLPDALRRLSQAPGVDASFGLSGTPRTLPTATEVVLLRVCQEALANVRKHARAQRATVELGYDPDTVRLDVSDDGAGFDLDRVSGGYGLHGMRTRVAEAGGTLTVHSSPGAGTRVSAMVPA
jgi:signal transduction histidine kinase